MASGSSERDLLLRRLILLIFVDWLPPDLFSSRRCFSLGSGVTSLAVALNAVEDSPFRGHAPSYLLPFAITIFFFISSSLFSPPEAVASFSPEHAINNSIHFTLTIGVTESWRAMLQAKAAISRAMAMITTGLSLPLITSRR
jgi:hypothetical protein